MASVNSFKSEKHHFLNKLGGRPNLSMSSMHIASPNESPHHPTPENFEHFLPWACKQFPACINVIVKNVCQVETSTDRKGKPKPKMVAAPSDIISAISDFDDSMSTVDPFTVIVQAVLDSDSNLIKLKFLKNKHVPRMIIKLLQLIVQFHPYFESITIDRGLDQSTLYDIAKLAQMCNLTDICLDGTFLVQANYYILLDNPHQLKYLSLSKCAISDTVVGKIAERLEYPRPASKILSVLYLSINRITDVGARALGKALRSNRQLSYLNLAGNMITDDGARAIFDVLLPFPLTQDEINASQSRYVEYFKKKIAAINKFLSDMPVPAQKKGGQQSAPKKTDEGTIDKAIELAKGVCGERYTESFVADKVVKDDIVYCNGNNSLAYINLAYNNLSQCSLKKIIEVLTHQNSSLRKPRGLVNLNIEGNPFHSNAVHHLNAIDSMIEIGLSMDSQFKSPSFLKKPKAKPSSAK